MLVLWLALAKYLPGKGTIRDSWAPPELLPWDELRATESSFLLTWSPAYNPYEAVKEYELELRRPMFPIEELATMEKGTSEDLRQRNRPNPLWHEQTEWSEWVVIYVGLPRVFQLSEGLVAGHSYEVRVRAHGVRGSVTAWSTPQLVHTLLEAHFERFPIHLIGTGRNNPEYSVIE